MTLLLDGSAVFEFGSGKVTISPVKYDLGDAKLFKRDDAQVLRGCHFVYFGPLGVLFI